MPTMIVQCTCGAQQEVEEVTSGGVVQCGECGDFVEVPLYPVVPLEMMTEPAPPSLDIPTTLPPALRSREQSLHATAGTAGLLLGLAVSAGGAILARPDSMLSKVFSLSSPTSVIPTAIMCMLFWGAVVCLLRWQRVKALEQLSTPQALHEAADFARARGVAALLSSLQGPVCQVSPLYKRLVAVGRQWALRPSVQDADVVLRQQSHSEQDGIYAGYNLVRTFVWAMPVLGLIGTVIGIALAVGGFARFLGGDVDDVSTIKASLVGVTGGLSFAFLITLEGLLGALLLMLPSSALQAREERLQSRTQQDFLDVMLPALQEAAPEILTFAVGVGDDGLHGNWADTLKEVSVETLDCVRLASEEVISTLDSWKSDQQRDVEQWATTLHAQLGDAASRLGEQVGCAGREFQASSGEFLARLQLFHETLQRDCAAQQQWRQQLADEEVTRQRAMLEVMAEHHVALNSAAGAVGDLAAVIGQVVAMQDTLERTVAEIHSSDMNEQLAQLLNAHAQAVQNASCAADRLAQATGETLACQHTLHASMRQLHETGLEATLGQFSEALVGLRPALEAFTQPGVWRWVVPQQTADATALSTPNS